MEERNIVVVNINHRFVGIEVDDRFIILQLQNIFLTPGICEFDPN